jgi:hypothetical protein
MLLLPARIWALNHIIAPHGITDLVHAHVYKQYPTLAAFYGGSTTAGWILHANHHDVWLYGLFGILSLVHFRHDFYFFPNWNATLVLMMQSSPLDAFLFYMVFAHVPNHFRMAWPYIEKHRLPTFALLMGAGAWCDCFLLNTLWNYPYWITSVIIGHILYQELGVQKHRA